MRKGSKLNQPQLYRRAQHASSKILDELSQKTLPSESQIRSLFGSPSTVIRSLEDANAQAKLAEQYARKIFGKISPQFAIPALLQSITDHYYGPSSSSKLQGVWLKRALELVARNVFFANRAQVGSLSKIVEGIRATAMWDQLQAFSYLFEELSGERDFIILNSFEDLNLFVGALHHR
jgi:hypothetical protein